MIDYMLLALAIVLMVIGIVGCVLPIIPGPPISFLGLLTLHFTKFADYSSGFLWLMALIALVVTVLDYIVPVWGTKKMGGSKAGIWGATIGLVGGIFFFPPIGIIIGPLAGAIIAESMKGEEFKKSFKAGMGSLLGFIMGVGIKLVASFVMSYYFITEIF